MTYFTTIILTLLLGCSVFAAEKVSLVGYKKDPKAPTRELKGSIHKIVETDTEFKLIIQGNAAFYLLPKGSNAADIRTQLVSLHKSKTSVNAVVNAFSRQIITLETSSK